MIIKLKNMLNYVYSIMQCTITLTLEIMFLKEGEW